MFIYLINVLLLSAVPRDDFKVMGRNEGNRKQPWIDAKP